jgi:hypothetical protein
MKTSTRTFTAIGTGLLLWLCLFVPSQQALADNDSVSIGHDTRRRQTVRQRRVGIRLEHE